MGPKLLFLASTRSHIVNFHRPYLRALREQGWTVHGAWAGEEESLPELDGHFLLTLEKKMTSPANFRAARLLRDRIRREGYHTVIVHTSLAAFFARFALLGMKNRPRVINMVHGYLFDDDSGRARGALMLGAELLTAPVTDLLLTMNRWDFNMAREKKLGTEVAFIPGIGVDFSRLDSQRSGAPDLMRRTLDIPEDAFVLIYPAEFSGRKNQQLLIRAMASLPKEVMLVLPGKGDLLEECKALARTLGLEDRIRFPGHVGNVGAWYEMADAAVSSSRSEGLPFNIMEAMHAGLPVAATAVKGHTDLIEEGVTGLLFPFGDVDACARQISALLADRARARAMGEAASRAVEQYSLREVFPKVMEQYGKILTPVPEGEEE